MTGVQVGRAFLSLPADASEAGYNKGAIIDSGTTLAYLPEWIYEPLVNKVYKHDDESYILVSHTGI